MASWKRFKKTKEGKNRKAYWKGVTAALRV